MTALLPFTAILSAILCGALLRLARGGRLLAQPGRRSAHRRPTPHAGGVALYAAFAAGVLVAGRLYPFYDLTYLALFSLTGALVLLGALDDLWDLPVGLRFACFTLCCGAAVLLLWPRPVALALPLYWGLAALLTLGLMWAVNLYNFMDGIDGIAALQCILASTAAALLAYARGADPGYVCTLGLLAAAHAGFLVWNWPPARLFMGDAGSVPTGFLLGWLALLGAVRGELPWGCWAILLALFVVDASWTLAARACAGKRLTEAHREHAYQRLSRRWQSHLRVDMLLLGVLLLWLLPLAAAAARWPASQVFLVILAYIPLLAGMAKLARLA